VENFPKQVIGFGEGFGDGLGEDVGGTVWHCVPVKPLLQIHLSTPVHEPFPEQTVESVEAFPKHVKV
jgi:hypothetical protein